MMHMVIVAEVRSAQSPTELSVSLNLVLRAVHPHQVLTAVAHRSAVLDTYRLYGRWRYDSYHLLNIDFLPTQTGH